MSCGEWCPVKIFAMPNELAATESENPNDARRFHNANWP